MRPEEKFSTSLWSFIRESGSHWLALMSGGIITVMLGVFERASGKNVPLWIYACVLIFFLFLSCYLAWRDARKALIVKQAEIEETTIDGKQEYIREQLKKLLDEGTEFSGIQSFIINDRMRVNSFRCLNWRERTERFLARYYDDSHVKRFQKDGIIALEEFLSELLS